MSHNLSSYNAPRARRRIFYTPGQGFVSLITRAKPAKPAKLAIIETWVLRVAGWLSFICVYVTDGAQQCSVLQVISGDIDGIIHRHSLLLRGVRVLLVLFVLFVFTKSAVLYTYYFIHYYLDKKNTLVIYFCEYTRFEHAE